MDPTHAPGWRPRSRRIGPIVGMYDEPKTLEDLLVGASIALAAVPAIGAVIMFAVDWWSGHL